jgi:phenylalanyl-tRNA synthetase beta chain
MEKICETLWVSSHSIQLNTPGPAWFHPGQSANMMLGKTAIGSFGMIHPEILAAFDIKVPVAAFDCNINAIPLPRRKNVARPLLKLSAFQPVERDFAFVLDEEVSAAKLLRAVRAAAKDKISDIGIFDVYEGAEIGDGKKSIAVKIQLTPDEATFTEAELQQISADIVASVEKQCAGKLRG